MSLLLDPDFIMGCISGVGIAIAAKLVKDIVTWMIYRKGNASLTVELREAILRKLAGILVVLKFSKEKNRQIELADEYNEE